jgi:hypothetical protein
VAFAASFNACGIFRRMCFIFSLKAFVYVGSFVYFLCTWIALLCAFIYIDITYQKKKKKKEVFKDNFQAALLSLSPNIFLNANVDADTCSLKGYFIFPVYFYF